MFKQKTQAQVSSLKLKLNVKASCSSSILKLKGRAQDSSLRSKLMVQDKGSSSRLNFKTLFHL